MCWGGREAIPLTSHVGCVVGAVAVMAAMPYAVTVVHPLAAIAGWSRKFSAFMAGVELNILGGLHVSDGSHVSTPDGNGETPRITYLSQPSGRNAMSWECRLVSSAESVYHVRPVIPPPQLPRVAERREAKLCFAC